MLKFRQEGSELEGGSEGSEEAEGTMRSWGAAVPRPWPHFTMASQAVRLKHHNRW